VGTKRQPFETGKPISCRIGFDTNLKAELETWLQERFAAACHAAGQPGPVSNLRISPPLANWETEYFLAGLTAELFAVDAQDRVTSEMLEAGEAASYPLFSHEPLRLLRENVCQLAAAAQLVLQRGWLKRHLLLQPGRPEHRATADGFDLLVQLHPDEILISVEVKRSRLKLEKLIADLRACSRRGPHAHEDCGFPQNHPRHDFYVSKRPAYLWAVAPDAEFCLALKCEGNSVELEPLPSLPPRSLLELG
jgi:hypothetical protein